MPVRVDSSFFLCNARAPHHDDEDRCDQRCQEISSNIHPTNVSARDLSFYKSFCAALSSSSALAVVGSNSGENLKGG